MQVHPRYATIRAGATTIQTGAAMVAAGGAASLSLSLLDTRAGRGESCWLHIDCGRQRTIGSSNKTGPGGFGEGNSVWVRDGKGTHE